MLLEEKIFSLINQSHNILVVSHRKPDGDTLGSAGAWLVYLKEKNKQATGFCVDQIPTNLKFLLPQLPYRHDLETLNLSHYDLVIIVDCGSKSQTGIESLLINRPAKTMVINIDHHYTNDNYGDINLVRHDASSTSEIVYQLFRSQNINISKDMTNCLLTGILTDTTYFSNAATTIESIRAASHLLNQGAKIKQITDHVWRNKDIASLKLWGKVFDRLIYNTKYQIAIAIITQEDVKMEKLPDDALEGLSNFLTSISEAKIIMVLTQTDNNTIKGSLRTTHEEIDVARLAGQFGGGGHRKAAGFTVKGKIQLFKDKWQIV